MEQKSGLVSPIILALTVIVVVVVVVVASLICTWTHARAFSLCRPCLAPPSICSHSTCSCSASSCCSWFMRW